MSRTAMRNAPKRLSGFTTDRIAIDRVLEYRTVTA